jgi:hypothetical protein
VLVRGVGGDVVVLPFRSSAPQYASCRRTDTNALKNVSTVTMAASDATAAASGSLGTVATPLGEVTFEALTYRIPFVAPPELPDEPNGDPRNGKGDTNGDE